jgi:hypothetical protein
MNKLNGKQNACEFAPRPPSGAGRLLAMVGKGPVEFSWILLREPVSSNSQFYRSIARRYADVRREFEYDNGKSALLVKGHPGELASILRLHNLGNFHPDVVEGVWIGALPIPQEILACKPRSSDRYFEMLGLDRKGVPSFELVDVCSRLAGVDLRMVNHESGVLSSIFYIAGKGRAEAVGGLEEMWFAKCLPSADRHDIILAMNSDEVGNPALWIDYGDKLILDFRDSRPGQFNGFIQGVGSLVPSDHIISGKLLSPRSGANSDARVEIGMPKRPQDVRDRLEQHARNVGGKLDMRARVSWVIDGVLVVRPDLA